MIRLRFPSKSRVFVILMATAFFAGLLPGGCTAWMRALVQPVSFVQRVATGASQSANRALRDGTEGGISAEEARRLREERDELARQLAAQQFRINELQAHLDDVTGLRDQFLNRNAQVLFGRVIAHDSDPRRETIVISAGALAGVRPGHWVAAGRSALDVAEVDGRSMLARQWIIGRVLETQPFTSRVRLTTDPAFGGVRVRAARVQPDGSWSPVEESSIVEGRGKGRMLIGRATQNFFAAGATVVLLDDPGAPMTLSLGQITGARSIIDAPLFFDLDVKPWGDLDRLQYVYVIAPS